MTKWQIWYTNDRVYNDESIAITDLPLDGALVVMQYFGPNERRILQGSDWYFILPSGMWDQAESYEYKDVVDLTSLSVREAIMQRYPDATVVRGKLIDPDDYNDIVEEALGYFPEEDKGDCKGC